MSGQWRYIADEKVSASFGLAADEWLMGGYTHPNSPYSATLRLYTYRSHCVLVGRFQNVEAEVRVAECQRRGIAINRRPTGGGAIIMGEGQLGIALVTATSAAGSPTGAREAIQTYAPALIAGLASLGIEATFRGKNDIEVKGRKIAGLGAYLDEQGALLFHCSLLADLDLPLMLRLLNIPLEKISDKEIRLFEERLTTVSRELGRPITPAQIRPNIQKGVADTFAATMIPMDFAPKEHQEIACLEREKYLTPEWVYQKNSPQDSAGSSVRKTPAGLVRVDLSLAGEVIKNLVISGDFMTSPPALNRIEAGLRWSSIDPAQVTAVVRKELSPTEGQLLGLTPEELSQCIVAAAADARSRCACFLRPRPEPGDGP
ncbi:MAG: biotin/lipoate A/B protein ligase family protein [Chloroflexota bacterium]